MLRNEFESKIGPGLNALYTHHHVKLIGNEPRPWTGRAHLRYLYSDETQAEESFGFNPEAASRRALNLLETFGGKSLLRLIRRDPFVAINPFGLLDAFVDDTSEDGLSCTICFHGCPRVIIPHTNRDEAEELVEKIQPFLRNKLAQPAPTRKGAEIMLFVNR